MERRGDLVVSSLACVSSGPGWSPGVRFSILDPKAVLRGFNFYQMAL